MARNLGSLTVDLVLKMGGFTQGMDQAARATDDANKKLRGLARDGQQLAAALANPFEKLQVSVKAYDELLKAGAITQETYTRAVQAANDAFAQSDAATLKHNATLAEGAKLTQSLLTPTEKYEQELKNLDRLLKEGAISQETFNRATARAKASLQTGESGLKSFGSSLLAANRLLLGFGVGFSAISIIQGLKTAATEAIHFGESIGKLADQTGLARSTLAEFASVAKQFDNVGIDQLAVGFKNLQIAISDAASGNKAAAKTFEALGISIADIQDLPLDQQLARVADALKNVTGANDRAALGADLFKKAFLDIAPILADGAAGLERYLDAARKSGTATDEQIRALEAADNAIDKAGEAWDNLTRAATAAIVPALIPFLDSVTASLNGQKSGLDLAIQGWKDYLFIFSGGPLTAARNALKLFLRERDEAAKAPPITPVDTKLLGTGLAPGGHARQVSFIPQEPDKTPKTAGLTDAQRELKAAREQVEAFTQSLIEQRAAIGQTDEAALKYSITQGDIAKALEKLGPAGAAAREQLLGLADALSKDTAKAAIDDQIKSLQEQAATIGLTDDQAFEYSLTQGELAQAMLATGDSIDEQTKALRENYEVLKQRRAQVAAEAEAKDIYQSTRTSAERYTEALKHLREVQQATGLDSETVGRKLGDLAVQFHDTGDASKDFAAAIADLQAQLDAGVIKPEVFEAGKAEVLRKAAEAGGEAGKTFKDEAQRQSQGIFANFLDELAQGKLTNIVSAFGDMFRQIAAQALAAKLAEKLFSGIDEGISKLGGLFGGGGVFGGGDVPGFGVLAQSLGGGDSAAGAATAAATEASAAALTAAGSTITAGAAATEASAATLTAAGSTVTAGAAATEAGAASLAASGATVTAAAGAISAAAAQLAAAAATAATSSAASTGASLIGGAFPGGFAEGGHTGGVQPLAAATVAFAAPGYTGDGGKYEAAGFVRTQSYVLPKERVAEPGAKRFLAEFNRKGMAALRDPDALRTWIQDRAPAFPRLAAQLRSTAREPVGGIVHRAEHIVPPEKVREPGAIQFLREFHTRGMSAVGEIVNRLQISRERWSAAYASGGHVRETGATIAAGGAALKFAAPGYTGDGAEHELAGLVRERSYVLPKVRVDELGARRFLADFNRRGLDAIRAAALPKAADQLRAIAEAPGGIVHRAEHIVPPERVTQPGALSFLKEFHVRGMSAVREAVTHWQGARSQRTTRETFTSERAALGSRSTVSRLAEPLRHAASMERVSSVERDRQTDRSSTVRELIRGMRVPLAWPAGPHHRLHGYAAGGLVARAGGALVSPAAALRAAVRTVFPESRSYAGGGFVQPGAFDRASTAMRLSLPAVFGLPSPREFATGGLVPSYAMGGTVALSNTKHMSLATHTVSNDRRAVIVHQSITVNSPNGQVSRQTEMQITAAAARGARVADQRNN